MSRETQIETLLEADATLMAILTGGIYTSGAVGPEGISRATTPSAFDANGYLKPTALVRQRDLVPDGNVQDGMAQMDSAIQVVEVWLYADQGDGYTAIDNAINRIYSVLRGVQLEDAFPLELANIIQRQRDEGALAGAALGRIDFAVYSIFGS